MRASTLICTGLLLLAETTSILAQEYRPDDFLPLAVGNSWTYMHGYQDMAYTRPVPGYDWPDERPPDWALSGGGEVTITITHTEQIDGKTYYVFSEIPYEWPPAPYFFLAGKKVRFTEEGRLMERWQDSETALFDFGERESYSIPEHEGDTSVGKLYRPIKIFPDWITFYFGGHENNREDRRAQFLQFFGMTESGFKFRPLDLDYPSFVNIVSPRYAVLDGKRIDMQDATYRRTIVQSNSWGQLKRVFFDIAVQGERR